MAYSASPPPPPVGGSPPVSTTLPEAVRAEIARVGEIKKYYDEEVGWVGTFASAMMKAAMGGAQAALDQGDAAALVQYLTELRGFTL